MATLKMFSLEGPDGCGKTTQAALIKERLNALGYHTILLKNPDVTPLGNFIRNNILQLDPWLRNKLLMLDIECTLKKLEGDSSAICLWDRFTDSVYASNGEMSLEDARFLTKELPKPNKTFYLDIDSEYIFSERKAALDSHSLPKWLDQKNERYRELCVLEPERLVRINARQAREVITDSIVEEILKNIKE